MKKSIKIITYGLLIYVAWNLGLFLTAIIFGFEDSVNVKPQDMLIGSLGTSMVVGLTAWLGARWLQLTNQRDRLMAGIIWMGEVIILLLIVTIANKTTDKIFGQWAVYISFLAILAGTLLGKSKGRALPTNPPNP